MAKSTLISFSRGEAYCISASGKDVEFIKHPTTWLNGECWKNEIQTGLLPNMPLRTQIDIEDAIRMFARSATGRASRPRQDCSIPRHAGADAKHGMLEDGRKSGKSQCAANSASRQAAGIREIERLL